MADNGAESQRVGDNVSFSLEDADDMSDADSRSESLTTAPSELKQYVGAEGGDDISLCSRVSNGNDSSCDSLVDAEESCPRYSTQSLLALYILYSQVNTVSGCRLDISVCSYLRALFTVICPRLIMT